MYQDIEASGVEILPGVHSEHTGSKEKETRVWVTGR